MTKYIPSSASNNTSITRINKIESMKYEIDDLDNGLCPPALSPYALSILDGKLNSTNNLNEKPIRRDSLRSTIHSRHNTATSMTLNELTSSSKLNPTNLNMNNTATNTSISRHSNFMTKLGLGAPRRLTNDGNFQSLANSRSVDNNINNSGIQLGKNKHLTETDKSRISPETENEIVGTINMKNETERKRLLELTPKKYLPSHKRTTTETTNININNNFNEISKSSPINNGCESHHSITNDKVIESPEIARRAIEPLSPEKLNRKIINLFDPLKDNNGFVLNLDQSFNKENSSLHTERKQNLNMDIPENFDHIKSILDKKKEIHSLKKEIKQYKSELLKQRERHEMEKNQSKELNQNNEDKSRYTPKGNENKILQIHKHTYKLYEQIGKGGSSKVYRGALVESPHHYLAIKIVDLEDQELSTTKELKGEIRILHKLRHCSRVVRLLDYLLTSKCIYFVMECGDLDLARVLSARHSLPRFYDLQFIRYHAQEMIKCIDAIHELDVVHLDLKPANFVFVSGTLKLIDFGISNSIKGHTVNVYREYQMGTPNYMSPETLLDCTENENGSSVWKVGKPADIWSLGCILYQLTYATTPYASYTGTKKILAITNPSINISYPATAVNLRKKLEKTEKTDNSQINNENTDENIKVCPYLIDIIRKCLIRDPSKRITSKELLRSAFINPVVVDQNVIKEVVRGCVGFGGRHPELVDVALGNTRDDSNDKRAHERLDRLIQGVWNRVSGEKIN